MMSNKLDPLYGRSNEPAGSSSGFPSLRMGQVYLQDIHIVFLALSELFRVVQIIRKVHKRVTTFFESSVYCQRTCLQMFDFVKITSFKALKKLLYRPNIVWNYLPHLRNHLSEAPSKLTAWGGKLAGCGDFWR